VAQSVGCRIDTDDVVGLEGKGMAISRLRHGLVDSDLGLFTVMHSNL